METTLRFSVVAFLALVPWTTATAASQEEVVFSTGPAGVVLVPVVIDGRGPFRFVLDTGSSHSTISRELAVRLALPAVAQTSVTTMAGSEPCLVVLARSMTIGGATRENLTPSVTPAARLRAVERGIDGIVGQDFLLSLNYTVDYRRKRLRWTADPHEEGQARVPLVREADRLLVRLPGSRGRGSILMVPDSGSEGFIIFEREGRTPVAVDYTSDLVEVAVLDGRQVGRGAVLRELEVGAVTLRNQRALVVARKGPRGIEGDGLMPLHQFSSVSFNNDEGYLIVRR